MAMTDEKIKREIANYEAQKKEFLWLIQIKARELTEEAVMQKLGTHLSQYSPLKQQLILAKTENAIINGLTVALAGIHGI